MSDVMQVTASRDGRNNEPFLRQGTWSFLPRPWMAVRQEDVLENEPIRPGTGKPHVCERVYRDGDAVVYVKGAVLHPDHATTHLPYWHQVVMNTRMKSRAMAEVALLD